jgi:hypothetical protein
MIEQQMYSPAIDTTADFLSRAEPTMTAVASRPAQHLEWVLPPRMQSYVELICDEQSLRAKTPAAKTEPSTKADLIVAQLLRFGSLDADWDGNDAAKPQQESLKDAREFIRLLAPESVIPQATLHADGHAVLLLHRPNIYAEIEFLGGKRIGFYARRGGQEWGDEILFNGGDLPVGLSQAGFVIEP